MLQRIRDEHGAVAVIVALLMVALLGAAAFAVDVGAMYSERAQLQNAADAAALGAAQACAKGNCGTMTATAQTLANLNSNDGSSNVTVSSPTATSVKVTTSTRDAKTGAGYLALSFAPVLGIKTKQVAASATAAWGSPSAGPDVLALAFAPCVFKLNGAIQVIQIQGNGGSSCSSTSPSGQVMPGSFGWLADPYGTCSANVAAGGTVLEGSTGVSISNDCDAALNNLYKNQTVLLPVYSDITNTGSGPAYVIQGWAAFRILGWNFPSGNPYNNNTYPGATCTGSCKGLIGQFVSFVSLDDRFSTGGPNLGVSVVTLTK
jgi:hypothetical protein